MALLLLSIEDGSQIKLNKAVVFFGRSNDCDIVLVNSRKVSRKHCCIAQINDSYVIRDLGSMNGVRVNEEIANPELPLNVGDELFIGDVGYVIQSMSTDANENPARPAPTEKNNKNLIDPNMVSMDFPVAIPEEGKEFAVEQSIEQPIVDSDLEG